MESVDDRLEWLRAPAGRQTESEGGVLDQTAIEFVLAVRCAKDSFESLEDQRRILAPGITWRRRRLGWVDAASSLDKGLCVNEVRVALAATGRVEPLVAMAQPELLDFEAIEHAYWQTCWAGGALRSDRGVKKTRLFLNMRELTCARSGAPRGPWEDLAAVQERVRLGQWKPEEIDLLPYMTPQYRPVEGDGEPLDVVRFLPAFPPSWSVTGHAHVLAATNGGYFLNFPEEYADGYSALHQPVGALFADGRLHMPPWIERPCAVEWVDNRRSIERLGPENLFLETDGAEGCGLEMGTVQPDGAATVWRSFDGPLPAAEPGGYVVDLIFCGAGLVRVTEPGAEPPPIGGAVVRLRGQMARPWRSWLRDPRREPFPDWKLVLRTSRDVQPAWVLASGPILVHDGRALREAEIFSPLAAGEMCPNGPPPTRFPYDATKTRAPRTAIGLSRNEEWVLLVVDGRADDTHSVGCTLEELARLMREVGCFYALNLDGGGSSVMAVEGVGGFDQLRPGLAATIANIPSDPGHRERIVPVALNVVQ
ncbi:MAG: phosphodiester glycosidase family protein [Candidatus Sumerlaeia bacterium]|nr:phosphodiester glycosidase family protein [Candidatus Sumerlaeia bacterium]